MRDGAGKSETQAPYVYKRRANDGPTAQSDSDDATAGMVAYGSDGDAVADMLDDADVASGNVLDNDSDPDNGALIEVTDVDGQGIGTVTGTYGTLTIASDGTWSYDIDENAAWLAGKIFNLEDDEVGPTE